MNIQHKSHPMCEGLRHQALIAANVTTAGSASDLIGLASEKRFPNPVYLSESTRCGVCLLRHILDHHSSPTQRNVFLLVSICRSVDTCASTRRTNSRNCPGAISTLRKSPRCRHSPDKGCIAYIIRTTHTAEWALSLRTHFNLASWN